jgi:hypothetical protein
MTTKKVFAFGLIVELLLFLVLLLSVKCDNAVNYQSSIMGKWESVDSAASDSEMTSIMVVEINEDGTYLFSGLLISESVRVLILSQRGIWKIDGTIILFYPGECKKINYQIGYLEDYDCDGESQLKLKNEMLTDGRVYFSKVKNE